MAKRMTNNNRSALINRSQAARMVRNMLAKVEETKIAQGSASGSTATAGAVYGLTSPIVQGTDTGQRTGIRIIVKSLHLYCQATINSSATSDRVRFVVCSDTENQNALPGVTDILASASVAAFPNIANEQSKRFIIYDDFVLQLNTAGSAGSRRKFISKVRNYPVNYAGSTGYGRNNLFLLVISDTPTNLATFAVATEVRYTDS